MIVSLALDELADWKGHTESDPWGRERVAHYWREIGQSPQDPATVPWSGAFVASVARRAWPGSLAPSGSHSVYARQAYVDAVNGTKGRWWARDPRVTPVAPGDIVVKSRGANTMTWEDLVRGVGFRESHGDIVTEVRPGKAFTIGGNIENAVRQREVPLDAGGRLLSPLWYAVLTYEGEASRFLGVKGESVPPRSGSGSLRSVLPSLLVVRDVVNEFVAFMEKRHGS